MRNALYGILVLSAIVVGFVLGHRHTGVQASNTGHRVLYYVDPMHPAYKSDKPGIAPDCGMDLEPVYADDEDQHEMNETPAEHKSEHPGAIYVSEQKQQLIGVQFGTADFGPAYDTIRGAAKVQ